MASESFTIGGELPVRRLGYGTVQLTGPGCWGPRGDPDDAVAVLRRAVDRGVTLIDTADNYGPDQNPRAASVRLTDVDATALG